MANAIIAPYARAAAFVKADGTLVRGKNITSVVPAGTGRYTVTVAEHIDTTTATCQVTADRSANWGTEVYVSTDASTNDHKVTVLTGRNGTASNEPFHLVVL